MTINLTEREDIAQIIEECVWAKVEQHDGVSVITYNGIDEAADAILARRSPSQPATTGYMQVLKGPVPISGIEEAGNILAGPSSPDPSALVGELVDRAESYRQSGPSAEHTAARR